MRVSAVNSERLVAKLSFLIPTEFTEFTYEEQKEKKKTKEREKSNKNPTSLVIGMCQKVVRNDERNASSKTAITIKRRIKREKKKKKKKQKTFGKKRRKKSWEKKNSSSSSNNNNNGKNEIKWNRKYEK